MICCPMRTPCLLAAVALATANDAPLVGSLRLLRGTLDAAPPGSLNVPALYELRSCLGQALADPDEQGLTRLHRAVLDCDVERVGTLLQAGADHEAGAGLLEVKPLHLSILNGDERTAVLEKMLSAGCAADVVDKYGTTALHAAATLNLPHCTGLLLAHGADLTRPGPKGASCLQLAAWSNAAEAASVLIEAGASAADPPADSKGRFPTHAAAEKDAAETLEVLIEAGADFERGDERTGRRPLHYSVRSCNCCDPACTSVRSLQLLLELGCDPTAEDRRGWTAVHMAAELNRPAPLRLLLERGTSPDGSGGAGVPPLVLAAHTGARESVAVLLAAGASLEARDPHGASPLHAAAANPQGLTLEQLLDAGAAADAVDDAGLSACHYAARAGSVPALKLLRRRGLPLHNVARRTGWTPLHAAANYSQVGATRYLLARGGKGARAARRERRHGASPLHVAAEALGRGTGGCTCHRCVRLQARRVQTMEMLLDAGVPTAGAAHVSAASDDGVGLRLLRARRADLWAKDGQGRTPLQLARAATRGKSSRAVRALLMMAGAPRDQEGAEAGVEKGAAGRD